MIRGDVWWVEFSTSLGGEVQKTRPAVIISNNSSNKYLNRVQVIPLSSQIEKVYPSEAIVKLGKKRSKAMADQIATVSKERLKNKLTHLSSSDMASLERAVRVQLEI